MKHIIPGLILLLSGCSDDLAAPGSLCGVSIAAPVPMVTDFEAGKSCACQQQKPIFLYFSAHGLGYDVFSRELIYNKKIQQYLREYFVPVVLLTDDRTPIDSSGFDTKAVVERLEKMQNSDLNIKTVGDLNSYLEAMLYHKNCQPYYVLMDCKERLLTEPFNYTRDPAVFLKNLETALQKFNKTPTQ